MSSDWSRWPSRDSPGFPVHAEEILHCAQKLGVQTPALPCASSVFFFFSSLSTSQDCFQTQSSFHKKMNLNCRLSRMQNRSKVELGSPHTLFYNWGRICFFFFFLNIFFYYKCVCMQTRTHLYICTSNHSLFSPCGSGRLSLDLQAYQKMLLLAEPSCLPCSPIFLPFPPALMELFFLAQWEVVGRSLLCKACLVWKFLILPVHFWKNHCPEQSNVRLAAGSLCHTDHTAGWNREDFLLDGASIYLGMCLCWVKISKLQSRDIPRSNTEPIVLSVSSWNPRIPTSFSCHEVISRGKTAAGSQANWDWCQLFIPDAKSQMHTHSPLPLPKPEVSNFIEFINSLRGLLKELYYRLCLQRNRPPLSSGRPGNLHVKRQHSRPISSA